ncbi:MAG: hypothetical protein AAF196_07840 [Planctomycetota bacterium]
MKCILASATTALLLQSVCPAQIDQNDPSTPIETTLSAIRQSPEAYRGVYSRFEIQFDTVGQVQNPFFTRFVPSEFVNFFAWDGEQPIWRKSEFHNVFAMLFMSKLNEQSSEIHRLSIYDRLSCVGIVRSTFQGKPWIEVLSFEKMVTKVDTPTLAHLYRAETWMNRRDWSKAISELGLATDSRQPSFVRSAVRRNLGVCHMRMGEVEEGRRHLKAAVALDGRKDRSLVAMEREARQQPRNQLDLEVSTRQLTDAERPMWEAFDDASASTPAAPVR